MEAKMSANDLQIGAGRKLPKLLFLTSREALTANVGEDATTAVLEAAARSGVLYDAFSPPKAGVTDIDASRPVLQQRPDIEGIVILGGYDVVSGRVVDCLPPSIRQRIDATRDADLFYVWSDDPYADKDGDGFPDLPVSRVPDAHVADFFMTCLEADSRPRPVARKGFRNRKRPFADPIYALMPGADPMVTSLPTRVDVPPPVALDGDLAYLMLHGGSEDASFFDGEEPLFPVAMDITCVPNPGPRVVLAGCCWGALTIDQRAVEAKMSGVPFNVRGPHDSIALSFLSAGATAFVGCTGSHYSAPDPPEPLCFGGPIHRDFWVSLSAGAPPALALLEAKNGYRLSFPHGVSDPADLAIEYKSFRQFTSIGLGW